MTKVALRAYNHEIESLIEQGQRLDEAIAHCRHILASYPKHLATYRLLGKAHLEAKQHDQAVDIFQRVLVSAPDDFVSHVGMSIITDDQGKLDEAIWHMERAFEVQPSNAAIQSELQRLFGRRDGVEPPKIRLTRGALAQMYVQGELYTQAISEIRAVLATDSERMDMQVLLARAYFRNGQKAEAADICSALLAISPYCLDANRLMAEILPGTEATEAALECRRRVLDLDPYSEFTKGSLFATDAVPDGSVTLDRLEYVGEAAQVSGGNAMGLASGLRAAAQADVVPSWLSSGAQPAAATEAPAESDQTQDRDLPDFLRGSGWREVPAESLDVTRSAPDGGESNPESEFESDALPGELPEWVRALAPNEDQEPATATAEEPGPDRWQQVRPRSLDTGADAAGVPTTDTPDWLRDLAKDAEPPNEAVSLERDRHPVAPTKATEPSAAPAGPADNDNGLAWLEGLAEKQGAKPEELITPPDARPATPPDWIAKLGPDEAAASEGWRPLDAGLPVSASERAAPRSEQPPSATGSSLDWLSGLADSDAFANMERPAESESVPPSGDATPMIQPAPAAEEYLPDWLADKPDKRPSVSPEITREPSGEFESSVDLPDWLADIDGVKGSSAPAVLPEDAAAEVPEWLQASRARPEPAGAAPPWRPQGSEALPAGKPEVRRTESGPMQSEVGTRLPAPAESRGEAALTPRVRAVPQAPAGDVSSLSAARAEMARGNIAAALDTYGRLIRRGKSLTDIIRELRDALYRYPVEIPIWQALGDAYMRANRLQEALDAYTKAEELLR